MPGDAQFLTVQSFYEARCPGLGTSQGAPCVLPILGSPDPPVAAGT